MKAKVRQIVYVNDKVRTKEKSRAEITLKDGGKLRIRANGSKCEAVGETLQCESEPGENLGEYKSCLW